MDAGGLTVAQRPVRRAGHLGDGGESIPFLRTATSDTKGLATGIDVNFITEANSHASLFLLGAELRMDLFEHLERERRNCFVLAMAAITRMSPLRTKKAKRIVVARKRKSMKAKPPRLAPADSPSFFAALSMTIKEVAASGWFMNVT